MKKTGFWGKPLVMGKKSKIHFEQKKDPEQSGWIPVLRLFTTYSVGTFGLHLLPVCGFRCRLVDVSITKINEIRAIKIYCFDNPGFGCYTQQKCTQRTPKELQYKLS